MAAHPPTDSNLIRIGFKPPTDLLRIEGGPLARRPAQEGELEAGWRDLVKDLEPEIGSEPGHHDEKRVLDQRSPQEDENEDLQPSVDHPTYSAGPTWYCSMRPPGIVRTLRKTLLSRKPTR